MSKKTNVKLRQVILDCWELLQFKPKQKPLWLATRLRNEELIENQEELINQLKEILEPVVEKIKNESTQNDQSS